MSRDEQLCPRTHISVTKTKHKLDKTDCLIDLMHYQSPSCHPALKFDNLKSDTASFLLSKYGINSSQVQALLAVALKDYFEKVPLARPEQHEKQIKDRYRLVAMDKRTIL